MIMDPLLGSILLVPYEFIPQYWAECNGQPLSIRNNEALFSLIGCKFGGDNHTVFNLPKLQAPEGFHYIIATSGVYPSRQ